ncbi:MAG: Hsp70 family protein, partial [Candidatus Aminicenantes bacterium]|nr:Hsp70 family protein [Candidatus Aminicenantes bacterium]
EIKSKKFDFRIEKKKAGEFEGILAIDFGTTNTTAAYEKDASTWFIPLDEIFSDPQKKELLASVIRYVRIKDDIPQEYVIGENARSLMIFFPRSTVMSIKTRLGNKEKIKVWPAEKNSNPDEFTAVEITSHILERLKKMVENHLKKRVTSAVISHPSKFTHIQVQQLRTAFERAGIQVRDTIEEPNATAIDYIIENKEKTGKEDSYVIGVFDCGGGTTDITLITVQDSHEEAIRDINLKVLATDGDARFGGNNLTDIMMNILAQKIDNKEIKFIGEVEDSDGLRFFYKEADVSNEDMIKRMTPRGIDWEKIVMENRQALWNLAETCKIELSDDKEPVIKKSASFTFFNRNDEPGIFDIELRIRREEFEKKIKPIIEEFIKKLERMEKKTGKACDVVLLSGMSFKIPLFYQLFFKHYGNKVKYAADLKKSVVRGVVKYYDRTKNLGDIKLKFDRGQKLTSPIGIQKTNREGKREFFEVFPQGSDVPTKPKRINLPLRRSFLIKIMRNLGTWDIIEEAPQEFEVMATWDIVLPDNVADKELKTGKIYLQVDEALTPKLSIQVGDY